MNYTHPHPDGLLLITSADLPAYALAALILALGLARLAWVAGRASALRDAGDARREADWFRALADHRKEELGIALNERDAARSARRLMEDECVRLAMERDRERAERDRLAAERGGAATGAWLVGGVRGGGMEPGRN